MKNKLTKEQLNFLKVYCPEIITQINFTKMKRLVELQPPKWDHINHTDEEIKEDKIKDNLC